MTTLREVIGRLKAETGLSPCILLGNGINRFSDETKRRVGSWEDLVKDLIEKFAGASRLADVALGEDKSQLTNLELMDLLAQSSDEKRKLRKIISEKLTVLGDSSPRSRGFLEVATEFDCPILTTNYDQFLEHEYAKTWGPIEAHTFKGAPFSPLLFSTSWKPVDQRGLDFSIWHIHGTTELKSGKYSASMRLTHSDYFGLYRGAHERLQRSGNLFSQRPDWKATNSWLDLFFVRPIVIVGLGLGTEEIVLRWLFLQRQKYLRRHKWAQPTVIKLQAAEDEGGPSKFVELVGGLNLFCASYDDLYL